MPPKKQNGMYNNILVLWSLPKTQGQTELYTVLVDTCKGFADIVKSPIDIPNSSETSKERYLRALQNVKESDIVIWDQSSPSTWQGVEIRECDILQKPLIILAQEWSKISGLVEGCPATQKIIFYKDLEDMRHQLIDVLNGTP